MTILFSEVCDENNHPEGGFLDAEGAIWVASPSSSDVLRIHADGEVGHSVEGETSAFACMFGRWIGAHSLSLQRRPITQMRQKPKSVAVSNSLVNVPGAGHP